MSLLEEVESDMERDFDDRLWLAITLQAARNGGVMSIPGECFRWLFVYLHRRGAYPVTGLGRARFITPFGFMRLEVEQ